MKMNYASVGDIVFVREKGIYVAEVLVWFDEPDIPVLSSAPAHKVSLTVRFIGSAEMSYSEIETKAIRLAETVLTESALALQNATGNSLMEFVEATDKARSERLRASLTASLQAKSN